MPDCPALAELENCELAELEEQLDWAPPALAELLPTFESILKLGGNGNLIPAPAAVFWEVELLEVAQLPLEPLTPVEVVPNLFDELLLQLYAFVFCVVRYVTAINAPTVITKPIARVNLSTIVI